MPELKDGEQPVEKTEPAPDTPPEGLGKSPEEMKAELAEAQQQIQRQAQELGELRKSEPPKQSSDFVPDEFYRQLWGQQPQYQQTQPVFHPQQGPPYQGPQPMWQQPGSFPQITSEDIINDPQGAISRYVETRLAVERQQREMAEGSRRRQEAYSDFNDGLSAAKRIDPKLFEGVEQEVAGQLAVLAQTGLVNSRNLRNPENWMKAARFIHLEKGNYDAIKPSGIRPVSATQTQLPNAAKSESPAQHVSFEPFSKELAAAFNLTEEEAEEAVKQSRSER